MSAHICGRAGNNIRKGIGVGLKGMGVGLKGVGLQIRNKRGDLNSGQILNIGQGILRI